jgi:D-alanyl-D-alanine carboxypeptidase (penicillin-binding protein 5/6)
MSLLRAKDRDRHLRARIILARALTLGWVILVAGCAAQTAAPAAPNPVAIEKTPARHIFQNAQAPFPPDATSAYVVDSQTGTVLYDYNSDDRMQPGSLAKLMTLYLVLDAINEKGTSLDTKVTILEDAAQLAKDPTISRMLLEQGQRVTIRDLLYGMMVHSGCDAAVALADWVAGDSVKFVAMMNDKARHLGMNNTYFAKPNGLPVPGEYSSARDMTLLAMSVTRQHPEAFTYTSARYFNFNNVNQRSTNGLLFLDPRVNGLKTGHVEEAGFHLVASARRGELQIISSLLGASSDSKRTTESEVLLKWAFDTITTVTPDWHTAMPDSLPVHDGDVATVAIAPIHSTALTILRSEKAKVRLAANLDHDLRAPVSKGQVVGELTVTCGSQETAIPVEATGGVTRAAALSR